MLHYAPPETSRFLSYTPLFAASCSSLLVRLLPIPSAARHPPRHPAKASAASTAASRPSPLGARVARSVRWKDAEEAGREGEKPRVPGAAGAGSRGGVRVRRARARSCAVRGCAVRVRA